MEIKRKLQELRNKLIGKSQTEIPKEVVLEPVKFIDNNTYRLHYIKYHTFGQRYGYSIQELINWPCEAFSIPKGMRPEDAFKVISYLTDRVEELESIEKASLRSVCVTNELLDVEGLGFERVERPLEDDSVISLFTIDGNFEKFKQSKEYPRYFDWYTPNVSKEEVENIYFNCGIKFTDLELDPKGKVMKISKISNKRITKPN